MNEVTIRKYEKGDLQEMIAVWNEVVEDGVAFPQEETLDSVGGEKFFAAQTYCGVAEVDGKCLDSIACTRITSAGAGTSATRATQSRQKAEGSTSAKSWCLTSSAGRMKRASECSGSTPSSGQTSTRAISMNVSDSNSSALSPAASE